MLIVFFALVVSADSGISCSASSLFILLNDYGREINFDTLCERLPSRKDGNSISELIEVARTFGMDLEAYDLQANNRRGELPHDSFIGYFRWPDPAIKVGHFVYFRSIGSDGKQFQMIDPQSIPLVVDRESFSSNPLFTGVVLVPKHKGVFRWLWVGLSLFSVNVFGVLWFRWGVRRARSANAITLR